MKSLQIINKAKFKKVNQSISLRLIFNKAKLKTPKITQKKQREIL